jgi:hypothetical protein
MSLPDLPQAEMHHRIERNSNGVGHYLGTREEYSINFDDESDLVLKSGPRPGLLVRYFVSVCIHHIHADNVSSQDVIAVPREWLQSCF